MNNEQKPIFVFGASGHAKVVIDIIERQGDYRIAFLADDAPDLKGTDMYDYRIIGGKEELLAASSIRQGIVAIGSNHDRERVAEWLIANGFELITAIHPSAQIGRGVCIGRGSVVMAGVEINSGTRIGSNAIINTRASIDHDCIINDAVHIAPGATLCGHVEIDSGTLICAGATIIPNIKIGSNVIVGAGATVILYLPSNCTAVGNPARIIKQGEQCQRKKLIIVGAGGFGREVLSYVLDIPENKRDWDIFGFLDDEPNVIADFDISVPLLGSIAGHQPQEDEVFVCAVGHPKTKQRICEKLLSQGAVFVSIVHPSVYVGPRVVIGRGCILAPYAMFTSDIVLGDFVIVNCFSGCGHDVTMGAYSTMSAHCDVTGFCQLGNGVFMGTHASILPGKKIGEFAVIGAGAVVIRNVPDGATVYGNPAVRLK